MSNTYTDEGCLDMTDKQKAQLFDESNELVAQLKDYDEKASEIQNKIDLLIEKANQEEHHSISEGVSYLVMKQQMLLSYCFDLSIYLGLKIRGVSIENHASTWQLLELRSVLEKLRPLDARLKYQLDKLFRVASTPTVVHPDAVSNDPLSFKPNPDALIAKNGFDEEENDDHSAVRKEKSSNGIYRAPRLAAVPYEEDDTKGRKADRKNERQIERVNRGEIVEALRHEFGDMPEIVRETSGGAVNESARRAMDREDRERQEFEEDHMIRLQKTKKYKKERRQKMQASSRLDSIVDVGRVGDFMRVAEMTEKSQRGGAKSGPKSKKRPAHGSLRLAIGAVGRSSKKRNKK